MSETRRSSRIAAQPKKEEPEKPAKAPRKTSKRAADDSGVEVKAQDKAPATKKVIVDSFETWDSTCQSLPG